MKKTNQILQTKELCPLPRREVRVRPLLLVFFLVIPFFSFAQDITGVWKGTFYVDSTKQTCKFQLTISEEKGKLTGYSRIEFLQDTVKQIVFREHTIKKENDQVIIEDDKQIKKASTIAQPGELRKIMTMQLSGDKDKMQLNGTWVTNKTKRFLSATGTAQIEKNVAYATTEIFQTLQKLKLADELSFAKAPKIAPVIKITADENSIAKETAEPLPEKVLKPKDIDMQKTAIAKAGAIATQKEIATIQITVPEPEKILTAKNITTEKAPIIIVEKPAGNMIVKAIKKPAETAVVKIIPVPKKAEPVSRKVNEKPVAETKSVAKIATPSTAIKPADNRIAKADSKEKIIARTAVPVTAAKPVVSKATPATAANATVLVVQKTTAAVNAIALRKDAALEADKRTTTSVQSIYYKTDSLQLTLYDNGEIDGDTVSVLLNGKVIIAKQGLNLKPNVHTIYFDANTPDSVSLVMYAENLGAIPPNTGLLVIKDGSSTYEVRFSADLSSNAAIILRRRKRE